MPGGERVRLCNPCVPDPNTAPPQSPTPLSPRSPHHRSRSSLSNAYGGMPTTGRFGGLAGALQAVNDPPQYSSSRTRSIALVRKSTACLGWHSANRRIRIHLQEGTTRYRHRAAVLRTRLHLNGTCRCVQGMQGRPSSALIQDCSRM